MGKEVTEETSKYEEGVNGVAEMENTWCCRVGTRKDAWKGDKRLCEHWLQMPGGHGGGQVIRLKRPRFWMHIWLNQWTTGLCLHLQSEEAFMFTECPKAQDGSTFPGHPLFHWALERKNPDLIPA